MNRFLIVISAVSSFVIAIIIVYVVIAIRQPIHIVPSGFNFAAVGDWGCNSNTHDTVNNILSKKPQLVLGLGDYSYSSTADCWIQMVEPIEDKIKIAIGNHDDRLGGEGRVTNGKLQEYMDHFDLKEQYYSFDYHKIHFIILSTELAYKADSPQYEFVKNDLSKAASDPNIDWIIVCFHIQMYASQSKHGVLPALASIYHPLFDKYRVDLVLQAHNHNYERTYPIKFNINSPSNPIITSTNKNTYADHEGEIFATVGTGGQSLYPFKNKQDYFVKQYVGFGILDIDLSKDEKTLTGKFYTNNDKIIDQFTITHK